MRKKIALIGAGNIGGTLAHLAALKGLGDVVLYDVVDGLPQGKALDLAESGPIEGFDASIVGTNKIEDIAGADVCIVTSGVARKPGMSRDDLLNVNYKIMQDVTAEIVKHSPNCIIVPVANPLDAMSQAVFRLSGFPRERVMGMAGVLDSARMRTFVAEELKVSVADVTCFVLGGHGDTMVPLPRLSTVAGIPLPELIPADRLQAICDRTANGGAEITKLVGTSAWYAPGVSAADMVEAILKDQQRIMPCSVYLQGEYGINNLFVGVPVKVGARGVEQIIEVALTEAERAALHKSAGAVKELVDVIGV